MLFCLIRMSVYLESVEGEWIKDEQADFDANLSSSHFAWCRSGFGIALAQRDGKAIIER